MNIDNFSKYKLILISILLVLISACRTDDELTIPDSEPEMEDLSFANNFTENFDSSFYSFPDETFIRAKSIASFPDGSFAYAGYSSTSDIKVIKMNANCSIAWKSSNGIFFSLPQKLIALQDGGLLLLSDAQSWDYNTNEEFKTISTTRFSASGELLWTRDYDYMERNKSYDVIELADGKFMIAGEVINLDGDYDTFSNAVLILTTATGQEIWHKIIHIGIKDYIRSIQVNENSEFLILGYELNPSVIGEQIFMLNIDINGNVLWEKKILNHNYIDESLSCTKTENGEFICATTTIINDFNFSSDLRLLRLTAQGEVVWSVNYGDSTYVTGIKILPTANNEYFVLGNYEKDRFDNTNRPNLFVMKIDEMGERLWTNSFASTSNEMTAYDMITTPDHGLIICGKDGISFSTNSFLLKLNADGFPQ